MTADIRVIPLGHGRLQAIPLTDRAQEFAQRGTTSILRFLRAAHDAGLVVG